MHIWEAIVNPVVWLVRLDTNRGGPEAMRSWILPTVLACSILGGVALLSLRMEALQQQIQQLSPTVQTPPNGQILSTDATTPDGIVVTVTTDTRDYPSVDDAIAAHLATVRAIEAGNDD